MSFLQNCRPRHRGGRRVTPYTRESEVGSLTTVEGQDIFCRNKKEHSEERKRTVGKVVETLLKGHNLWMTNFIDLTKD